MSYKEEIKEGLKIEVGFKRLYGTKVAINECIDDQVS